LMEILLIEIAIFLALMFILIFVAPWFYFFFHERDFSLSNLYGKYLDFVDGTVNRRKG
jgi:hypothetical protein